MRIRPTIVAAIAFAVLVGACSKPQPGPTNRTFAASVASSDLYAGTPQRFELGIQAYDPSGGVQLLSYGTVSFGFAYLGDGSGSPEPGPTAAGTYIPAPGVGTGSGSAPTLTDPADARGVYGAENVSFDKAGSWQVSVTAEIEGSSHDLQAAFTVTAEPQLLAPGDRAHRTENLTLASKGVPKSAIDSRALNGAAVPDPELHRWTIAKALAQHRPILVVFATPTYCTSLFCGPTTDAVAQLAQQYPDRAVYIHIEIYEDFNKGAINRAAAEWLEPVGSEPWLFLIGADGRVLDRWSPLFDPEEVGSQLAALPPMTS